MAGTSPRAPEQYYHREPGIEVEVVDFRVNEIAADQAGGLSPFGPDREFPLPIEKIRYTHPGPADRPRLANGR